VGYAAPGTWPHAARDCQAGREVFPPTMPDDCLVNLYGRAAGAARQVPKAERHEHLPGTKGYFNATVLPDDAGLRSVCEGGWGALVPSFIEFFGTLHYDQKARGIQEV